MPKLSIISHYYNHPQMVQDQIAYWESLPDSFLSQVEFVLIDDCSEKTPLISATKLNLRVYRVITDVPWNQGGARNLGAFNATGDWALYFDIDQKFYVEPMVAVLDCLDRLDTMAMYYFRIKELIDITVNKSLANHPNTFLVNLPKFKELAMYDEDFCGHYGYEDLYMPQVWEKHGGKRVLFGETIFFEDMGFGTTNLNRDLSRNLALAQYKMATGTKKPSGILRFEWECVSVKSLCDTPDQLLVNGEARFKPRSFHLVDPGLIEAGGHYHTQDLSIARECQARGIPVTIYCRRGANLDAPDINLVEILRFDVFIEQPPINPNFAVFENYFLINRAFMQDLNLMLSVDFSPDDIVYFPTLTQNQIEAVADWVISLPVNRRPHIAITLRLLNSQMHYNLNRGYAPSIEFLYQHVLAKLIERHPNTHLFSDTQALSTIYSSLSGIPIVTLPVPQIELNAEYKRDRPAGKGGLSILYIGNVSPYRGNHFISKIIENVLSKFSDVEFTIQVKADAESDAARTMLAIPEVYAMRVNYLFGTLSPDDYVSTMQAADIVLLPYMPAYYSFGSSGVFTEAAALGKVLVVTAGTTMETTASNFDLGAVIASEYTAESFSDAIGTAIDNFGELDQKASASYVKFARENSPEGFLDHMFSCIV